jgi:hypothetical protein
VDLKVILPIFVPTSLRGQQTIKIVAGGKLSSDWGDARARILKDFEMQLS